MVLHKCLDSSATWFVPDIARPPILHDRACSTIILALQPSQAAGISSGEWLYCRWTLSLHLSADMPLPFNRLGKTESHAPAAQLHLSHLATEGLFWPQWLRKICSFSSCSLRASRPALSGARAVSPRVKPSGRVHNHKRHCQVARCRKGGLVDTWSCVHRVADCQPPPT